MLLELMIAVTQGVSQALTERFIKGRETSANINTIVQDIAKMKAIQIEDKKQAAELRRIVIEVLKGTDGLQVSRYKVSFKPTETSATPESTLLNLDLAIERLRSTVPVKQSATLAVPTTQRSGKEMVLYRSVLEGLEEEIEQVRRGQGSNGT
jgi:hypothetical protein